LFLQIKCHTIFHHRIAEVLISAGKTEEGEKLLSDIIKYSKEYLDYAISLKHDERFGLDYATGINMQDYSIYIIWL